MEILMRRFFLAILLAGAARVQAAVPGAIMLVPNGSVQVRSGSEGAWTTVSGPTALAAGQEVRTSEQAGALIQFPDGSKLLLSHDSQFQVNRSDSKESVFTLPVGRLRAAISGWLSSHISIHTPTAVCAVRGTVFELGADAKSTEVSMAEGVLEVKDRQGRQAVVTSEETLKIGAGGMEQPHLVGLHDSRALEAVRPMAVHLEMARDATRIMLEDLRHRELKANESQLGKEVVDAFGRRVRMEEYLLRPDNSSFKLLFLSSRKDRFDWGYLQEIFNSKIPDNTSMWPGIIAATFMSQTKPANWLKSMEFYATNTRDWEKEHIDYGTPVAINFAGYGLGTLYYPQSMDWTQTLGGPGILNNDPNGRTQYKQHQDYALTYNTSNSASILGAGNNFNLYTWTQSVQAGPAGTDNLTEMIRVVVDPSNTDPADPLSPQNPPSPGVVISGGTGYAPYDNTNNMPLNPYPNGPNKADLLAGTQYPDGSTLQVEKFLVSNDGKLYDSSNANSATFSQNGNYNLEINIKSNLFQGRDIDVLIAPEIFQQTRKSKSSDVGNFNF